MRPMPLRTAPTSSNEGRLPTVNPGANGMAPTPLPLTDAAVLLDQLQPRRLGLRLVAGGAGQVGADVRGHQVDGAARPTHAGDLLAMDDDRADAGQLVHDARDMVGARADALSQLLTG